MPNYALKQVGVVVQGVRDLNRAVSFYRDTLGLAQKTQFEGLAFFDAGSVTLVLSEPLAKAISSVAGATELVFSVPDVMHAYNSLRENGVQFRIEPRNVVGSDWAANFDDPDGHALCIFGPKGS